MDKWHNIFNFSLLQKIEILFKQKGIDNPEKERKAKMSKQTQSIAKPFCKVCHDAGKTVAEYSTHYVRESRGGAVVCPTILNQQCNYCKKHGHTPSHCPALQAKQVQAKQVQAHEAKQVQAHEGKQVQAHEAKQVQAKQVQAKQVQAQAQARLCELPQMENNILVPVIKPVALKMKSWASVVSKKPAPAQEEQEQEQAQEEQAQRAQEQAQRAQAPEEQEQEQAQEEQEQAQRAQAQAQEEQAQRVQAQEEQERVQAPAQEEQEQEQAQEEQAQEQAQEEQEQAPHEEQAFNYSNMAWADVE